MAAPTLQELLIGGFAFFLESGTTVDSQTVGPTVKPDNDPTTNWTNGTLGTILNFKFGKVEIDSPFLQPLASGGHQLINRKFCTQNFLTLQAREMGERVMRLEHGVSAIINEGTAQTPGAKLDRKIEGWLRLQGRSLTGYDRFTLDWWAEMRLEGENVFNENVVSPNLRFTLIRAVNGTAVAGNSTNFPAQSA
jgi:hypothetical protein